jgi:hypothetical protein
VTVKELIELLSALDQDKPILVEQDGMNVADEIKIKQYVKVDAYVIYS